MNRLWLQLALGFALVTLVSTLTVALVANATADVTFRGYLAQSQLAESGLAERLADYYAARRSWEGIESLLAASEGGGMGMGMGHGQRFGQGMMAGVALADAGGRVLVDAAGMVSGTRLSASERGAALPVVVEGRTVGYLLARTARGAALPAAAERFLSALNRTLWLTGLAATVLGLGLGLLIARRLAAPLGGLAAGARRIAAGQLDERVPVAGPAEVRTVATAFNEMAMALEAGETQRRQMVADIAHELRTPLTVIQGNLRAMLDDVYPLSKDEVATIYETSLGLRRLVDDLRELSLAEAGRLELRPQPVAVAPLLAREVALFADVAQGVTLRADAPPSVPDVLADPERLAQVLHNLVSNALRHTPAGGSVTLRVTAEAHAPGETRVTSHPSAVRFEVADTGAGIALADLPHVFERFYRADRGRAREQGGSGLGLAITRQLVLLQGGQIGVESTPGQGARFWFTLPAADVGRAGLLAPTTRAGAQPHRTDW
jgi:two-component system OmpR family sensor kinase/two-component system sensor histidine kinase BaeS